MSNVIRMSNKPVNMEEIQENIEKIRELHITSVCEELMAQLIRMMDVSGFSVSSESRESILYLIFIAETIKSLLSFTYDLEHPFHELSEHLFEEHQDDGISIFCLNEKNIENILAKLKT